MYKNDEDTAGIYCARCLANNKRYVGSSRKKLRRTIGHTKALLENTHSNKHFQNSWNKYGADCFVWEFLEECTEERLLEREQYWINHFQSFDRRFGYNFMPAMRQETSAPRMAAIHCAYWESLTPEEREERSAYMQTPEHRKQMSVKADAQWADEAFRLYMSAQVSETMTRMCRQPEHRARLKKISNDYWQTAEAKAKQRAVVLDQWANNPELRARRSKKSKPTKVHVYFLEVCGIEKPVRIWAEESGIPLNAVMDRFKKKEPLEKIFRPTYKYQMKPEFERWLFATLYGGTAAATGMGAI
jgi:group I intron endonuclease